MAELMANPVPVPPVSLATNVASAVPPHTVDGSGLTIQDLMVVQDEEAAKDRGLSEWLDERERLGFEKMAATKPTGIAQVDSSVIRSLAQKYMADGNKVNCRGNAITRSCAFTGSFVILEDGRRMLYPNCPGEIHSFTTHYLLHAHHHPSVNHHPSLIIHSPPTSFTITQLFAVIGWTQAINTLGLCANPTAEQLKAEKPVLQRPTRALERKYAAKNQQVEKVMVFKGANGKAAVIRAMTYDLLFNNMKSIVTNTAGSSMIYIYTHT